MQTNVENTEKNKKDDGWYHIKDLANDYYTPMPLKVEYHYFGDGEKIPTPRQIVETLNKEQGSYYEYGFFSIPAKYNSNIDPSRLPNGNYQYYPEEATKPQRLCQFELRNEKLVEFSDKEKEIIEEINDFVNSESVYRGIGTSYKRGMLLYGEPGNGKTVLIRQILSKQMFKNSINIFTSSVPQNDTLQKLKTVEADRFKIFIIEEITEITSNAYGMNHLLSFLDGENSIDKCFILATTNYPEKLPGNIVNRPSRFDRVIKIENPDKKTRARLLEFYLQRKATESEVNKSNEFSIAQIKEACIYSRIKGVSLDKAISMAQKHKAKVKNDFAAEKAEIGFSKRSLDMGEEW